MNVRASFLVLFAALAASVLPGCRVVLREPNAETLAHARELAHRFVIVDGHVDVPYRLGTHPDDVSTRTAGGDFDWPRAKLGGLDAPFMSIDTPAALEDEGGSFALAEKLIDGVEAIARKDPDKFVLVRTVADVNAAATAGKVGFLMGMENGSPIEGKLDNVDHFFRRGVRYITLCHGKDNHICDSSYDTRHTHKGLTPFGRDVVKRMNDLGIIVDVSHVSDDSFWQALELSRAPVFASHSSCRAFTPGLERNMSDEMIVAMAKKGGVILINFGSFFLDARITRLTLEQDERMQAALAARGIAPGTPAGDEFEEEYGRARPLPFADVHDVADHIDHVVRIAGIDHVGFGSDFDGVGDTLPVGLKDVSMYPNLIAILLQRGYSDEDIEKVCGGNALRVLGEVEKAARR